MTIFSLMFVGAAEISLVGEVNRERIFGFDGNAVKFIFSVKNYGF